MNTNDLKNILDNENHEVKTEFCKVPFTISSGRNVYNAIRNKYRKLALEAQAKFAEINEQFEDLDDLIDNAPDAFIFCIEKALLELIQDIISVDIYTIDKDAVVDKALNGEYFDEFVEAYTVIEKKYEKILTELNDEEYARELRKKSRPRWQSSTFGGNSINAWSNQIEAGCMNITEGIAHSIFNAVGNAISRSVARSEIKELFNSKSLRQNMVDNVYDSCFNLHFLLMDIVEANTSMHFEGLVSVTDKQKAQAMFNNLFLVSLAPEKRDKFIAQIFELNPYEKEFYVKIIKTMGDEDESVGKFSEYFGFNIFDIKNDILVEYVKENIGETEEDAENCYRAMEEYAGKIGLSAVQIVQARNLIEERLAYFNDLYCTVDGIKMASRAEADVAREELAKITEIINTIDKPTDTSDLFYEKSVIEKRNQISSFKTSVKDNYLELVDQILVDFDKLFRKEGKYNRSLTREEAAKIRAYEYAKSIQIATFEQLDIAAQSVEQFLPRVGIDKSQATSAYEYLSEVERNLCIIDGVQFPDRQEAIKALNELAEIKGMMSTVYPPNKESLLSYEKMLSDVRCKLDKFETPVKNKYIVLIDRYGRDFDACFRTVGFTTFITREDAADQRALNFAKNITPKNYNEQDMIEVRKQVDEYLGKVGLIYDNANRVKSYFEQCYQCLNTVDGIVFNSKEEAEAARTEYSEIMQIMNGVQKPNPNHLLDYEQGLLEIKAKLEGFNTPIKNKYIAIINDYIAKFDVAFKTIGVLSKAETRQQAAQIRALKLVKSLAPAGCTYFDVDKASEELDKILPKLGINREQAVEATEYISLQEEKLNTVDGVKFFDRESAALAATELESIKNIMFKVAPPQSDPLLSYEVKLLDIKCKLDEFKTPIKDKYIGIVKKYLVEFDEKFRRVSIIKVATTREEAAKERALKFVKGKMYNTVADVDMVRKELHKLLPELGITENQATEAEEYLVAVESKLNGITPQPKKRDTFGIFKK